jgi:methionyl-tRNA formyltransferase
VRGAHCLRALLAAKEPVAGVVGHAGSEAGELAKLAAEAGLPYRAPKGPNGDETLAWARGLGFGLAVMSGYAKIVKKPFLELFAEGVVNLHGGPLPSYRGGSPLNWQILRGEREIGLSIVITQEGIDDGPVLARDAFPLGPDETIDEVVAKTLPRFERMLLGVLDAKRRGALRPEPQDPAQARYFAKRLPEDSYPGAFTFHRGRKVVLERTRLLAETIIAPPGRVLARRAEGVEVACADRALLVVEARDELPKRDQTFDRAGPA